MKKTIIACIAAMLLAIPATTIGKGKASKSTTLEVSFNYQRQQGPGSNQYAVWIEDEKGEVVKTLFVTSFTTKGRARGNEPLVRGYVKRPACVPAWVKAVKANDLSDQQGKAVKDGTYRVMVEATLFNASTITYSGTFSTLDKAGNITLTSQLTQPDEKHKEMVTEVKARLK